MKARTYAIAFLAILVVFCVGAYFGVSAFLSLGDKLTPFLRRDPTPSPIAIVQPTSDSEATGEATAAPISTPTAPSIRTPEPPSPTPIPPTSTPAPPTATPLVWPTATSTEAPSATATTPSLFLFEPTGPVRHDTEQACTANYIRGSVVDADGKPLEGVKLRAYDQWGNETSATSKGGTDKGQYDIVIGGGADIWWVLAVDGAGNPLSPEVEVPHRQEGPDQDACWHWVDWRRTR